MKTLVVFDSLYGNTRKISDAIADTCRAYSDVRLEQADMLGDFELHDEEMLFIGSPTHNQNLSPNMKELLAHTVKPSFRGVKAATFDTRYEMPKWLMKLSAGTAANKLAGKLQSLGAKLQTQPESFLIEHNHEGPLLEGELERAQARAKYVLEKGREASLN